MCKKASEIKHSFIFSKNHASKTSKTTMEREFLAYDDVHAEEGTGLSSSHRQKENESIKASNHRRTSFQRSALRDLRINQKKHFHILKEAAIKANKLELLRQGPRSDSNAKLLNNIKISFRDYHATIIQAVFRGYLCRKDNISGSYKPKKLHRRINSEITMSDFSSDSFCSLGSLEWSPKTNMRLNHEGYHHACTSTPETCTASNSLHQFDGFHDSFASIFSNEPVDLPARKPSRMLSPGKPDAREEGNILGEDSAEDLCFPEMTRERADSSFEYLPQPNTRRAEAGHSSFSSYFEQYEPVKRPQRPTSPVPFRS